MAPPCPDAIEDAFAQQSPKIAARLRELRELIFDVASEIEGVGSVAETLKWGQPSYAVKQGTPIRLGVSPSGDPALLVHCQTTLIAQARDVFPDDLEFEGNRAICLPVKQNLPEVPLRQVIRWALTYKIKTAA